MSKLLARKGRAYLRAGMMNEADDTFNGAIHLSESALAFHEKIRQTASTTCGRISFEIVSGLILGLSRA